MQAFEFKLSQILQKRQLGKTLLGVLFSCNVQGGLCGNEEFEKALAEIQYDTYHNGAGTFKLWIGMLVRGEVNNAGRHAAKACSSSSLDRWQIVLRSASKPGVCSSRAPDSAGGL